MSADLKASQAASSSSGAGLGQALYFNSGGNQLFGWLHMPVEEAGSDLGVVICKPFGYEAICAQRSVRTFAETAAASGIPTLRFDYAGTGDSSDIEPDVDQLALWASDVVAAIGELRRRTGVSRVCLIGIRLGALLATMAARHCSPIESVILVAPVVNGRKYMRELRTAHLVAGLTSKSVDSPSDAAEARPPTISHAQTSIAGRSMEVAGFTLSAATLASLALVDLDTLAQPLAADMLILDGSDFSTAKKWNTSLASRGIKATYMALPGLVGMVMTAPQFAVVPREMTEAIRNWLVRSLAETSRVRSTICAGVPPSSTNAVVSLSTNDPRLPGIITERPVFIGSDPMLFGIATEPTLDEIRHRAVILLNAGVDYHIGASRMYVSLARQWARRGYLVLRLDLRGIGDSATGAGCTDDEVFPPEAVADICSAIGFLHKRYDIRDVALAGLCSGAYHALQAAAAPIPISQILMVNPQNYFWKKGMALEQLQLAEVVHNPSIYRERVFSIAAWTRLFSGRVNIWRIVMIYLQRLSLTLESTFREIARRIRIHLPNDLGWELEEIAGRGIDAVFVFAHGDPGIGLLELQGGSVVGRLGNRCRVHIIEGGDHIFSQSGPRLRMERILSDELFSRADSHGLIRNPGNSATNMALPV